MSDRDYDQKKKEQLRLKQAEERREAERIRRIQEQNRPVDTASPEEIKELLGQWAKK